MNKDIYELSLIMIDKQGIWWLIDAEDLEQPLSRHQITLIPSVNGATIYDLERRQTLKTLDVAFPVLHGSYGEDGTIQGLFKMVDLPFVGTGVLASSACMDKDICKRLLKEAGLNVASGMVVTANTVHQTSYADVVEVVGSPFFIKPANAGSSVGVHKVKHPRTDALIFRWDIDVVYAWSGGDGEFWTDTEQLRYAIRKAGLVPSGAQYNFVLRVKPGTPDLPGWSDAKTRSTLGMVRQSLETTVEHSGLGANTSYWRKE